MNFTHPFFPRATFLFKGGGGGVPAPVAAPVQTIVQPAPVAPRPVPPVTDRTSEVVAAERQSKLDAAKKKGIRSTLLAGETGGFNPFKPAGPEQKKTLLG